MATNVLGDGPLYPIADYFRNGATLNLNQEGRAPDGSYQNKVRWLGQGHDRQRPRVLRLPGGRYDLQ